MELNFKGGVIEFIGTFVITYIGADTGTFFQDRSTGAIYQGFILGFLIYLGAKISGGHYNPTITTALYSIKKISLYNSILYQFFQILGAVAAGTVQVWINNTQETRKIYSRFKKKPEDPEFQDWQIGVQEMVMAFFVLFVI
jgi:aquaporin Z